MAHSDVGALTLAGASGLPLALVWGVHIGFNRALGYGLKYPTAVHDTHLGRMGHRTSLMSRGSVVKVDARFPSG